MVTYIPNVQNWTVTPQNGQSGYFTLMNTWLGQSTLVIASLQTAITAQNTANSEINALAIQTENNAIIATGLANFKGVWSGATTYSKGQSVESTSGSKIYYTSKVDNNLNYSVADTNYWLYNPINNKLDKDFLRSTNITVNVGVGQTYTTINQALEYLSGFYPMYKKSGVTATINLKAGFVMAEQVLVSGIDLGWITIVGEDAETIITHTALTTAFNGGHYPVFGVDKGGTSPVIGQLFRFNVEKVGGNKHGLMSSGAGSSANVLSGKGFIGAGTYGIYSYGGSTVNAEGANCSNAGTYGIYAVNVSAINAEGANCSNAGTHGIAAVNGSTINAKGAIVQNQTTGNARVMVIDGSTIEATGISTTGGTDPVFSQAVNTLTGNGIIYQ